MPEHPHPRPVVPADAPAAEPVPAALGAVSYAELRDAVAATLRTFVTEDGFVGAGADLAAADHVLSQVRWLVHGIRFAKDEQRAGGPDSFYNGVLHAERLLRKPDPQR